MKGDNDEYIFAKCYLTLEWNLMARSENIEQCHAQNICWKDDALGFHFPKTKGDQLGKRADAIWHVYANPQNPTTCPHLALARYLFSNPGTLTGEIHPKNEEDDLQEELQDDGLAMAPDIAIDGERLFPGRNQYERFMGILHSVIKENAEEFRKLGIEPGDLGSHSARKG